MLFLLHYGGVGGAEVWTRLMCRHLDRSRFEPVVLCIHPGTRETLRALEEDGTEVICLEVPDEEAEWDPVHYARIIAQTAARWPGGIDLVHNSLTTAPLEVAIAKEIPVLETIHGWLGYKGAPIKRHVAAFALVSRACWGGQVTIPENIPAYLVYNGVDVDFWNAECGMQNAEVTDRSDFRIPTSDFSVVWSGRLAAEKRPDRLVRIALELGEAAHITVAGGASTEWTQPTADAYRAQLEGFENITCLGKLRPPELREVYSRADVYLNTSDNEGLPLAAIEALACGCYPIVPRLAGGAPEIIERGGYGCVVDADNPREVAQAILRAPRDRARARQAAVKWFSARRMVEEYMRIYEQLMQNAECRSQK